MIWSFVKFAVFLAAIAGLAYGATFIMEDQGGVTIAFAGQELQLQPIQAAIALVLFIIALYVAFKVIGFLWALLKFINGDNTAISRYFDRSRETRGHKALSEGIIALAAGDSRTAMKRAATAEKLLDKPEVTQLISAQAATLSGDSHRAEVHFKELLKNDSTRFVGIRGLMQQKLDAGDNDTALKLAQKAFQANPSHDPTSETLFLLQSEDKDWSGARDTLKARVRTRALPKDVGARREAVLSLADAMSAGDDSGNLVREASLTANKLAPGLIPAAAMAARQYIATGEGRRAIAILKKAWTQNPHPDLAAAFAEIEPKETATERLKRFRPMLKIAPDATETRLLEAELNLAAEDFPAARKALGDLAETDPTARSLSIMAAIERGAGANEAVVSGWLAKALAAPRGDSWVCGNCNHIHGHWDPMCENCNGFDTLAWTRVPPNEDAQAMAAAMLPLMMGAQAEAEEPVAEAPIEEATVEEASVESGSVEEVVETLEDKAQEKRSETA